jgi:hypothetical protein
MGFGEDYWHVLFRGWWQAQPIDIKDRMRIKYPADGEWSGFWEDCLL